jgi:hypothetical protein
MLNINTSFGNSFDANSLSQYIKQTEFTECYILLKIFENTEV